MVAVGYLEKRLHILCFLPKTGGIRVISFRKANGRERANMANLKPLTDDEGEVRELTKEDLAQFVPFSALPAELQTLLSEEKHIAPDAETPSTRKPAA